MISNTLIAVSMVKATALSVALYLNVQGFFKHFAYVVARPFMYSKTGKGKGFPYSLPSVGLEADPGVHHRQSARR